MQKSDDLVKSVVLQSIKCTSQSPKLVMWAFSTKTFFPFNSVQFYFRKPRFTRCIVPYKASNQRYVIGHYL